MITEGGVTPAIRAATGAPVLCDVAADAAALRDALDCAVGIAGSCPPAAQAALKVGGVPAMPAAQAALKVGGVPAAAAALERAAAAPLAELDLEMCTAGVRLFVAMAEGADKLSIMKGAGRIWLGVRTSDSCVGDLFMWLCGRVGG